MSSREFKFRVWDKNMKRWWCEDSQYLQMDGKKIHPALWSTLSADLPDESIVIQQYTGLKDKNGKEIYEGDILKEKHKEYTGKFFETIKDPDKMVEYDYRGVVRWVTGIASDGYDLDGNRWMDSYACLGYRTFPLDTTVGQVLGNLITKDCEVVGNMYENSEMMERGPYGPKYVE